MIEEAEFEVTLTIRVATTIGFSPMERESAITTEDAVSAAIDSLPISDLEGEGFEIVGEGNSIYTKIIGEATELWRVSHDV